MNPPQALYIVFLFALGSCVGSFLNVVVWRLPRVEVVEGDSLFRAFFRSFEALSWPPSMCPKCKKPLKWYDNLPVIGWLKLGGRCRFCKEPISMRYPIIEAITGLLFVLYYVMFFMQGHGPCLERMSPDGTPHFIPAEMMIGEHWPIYAIDMMLVSGLLAASLIDAELFIIPPEIPWIMVPFALLEHALFDRPGWPGALNASPASAALAVGAMIGLGISLFLRARGIFPVSFVDGGPALEVEKARRQHDDPDAIEEREYTPREIRAEIRKEILFLLPPLALGFVAMVLTLRVPSISHAWADVVSHGWISGLLGSVLGMLVGGFVVWLTRILGSIGFGREAMGMGDVDLMAAVGAVLGAGPATVAFFIAPFFGMLLAVYMMLARKGRELPYGPYLSLASAFVILFYCPIADYLAEGVTGMGYMLSRLLGGG